MNNKTDAAVVIIGASGGIGRALASHLHDEGYALLLIGRSLAPLEEMASTLPGAQLAALDAGDRAALLAAVQDFAAAQGALTGIVNLAGSIFLKPAQRTTGDDLDAVLQANLVTAFNTVAVAQQVMRSGSVVLMSSVAATVGLMNHEAIGAAKAGVEGLMRAAAASGARRGLRFNAVAPALVDTPMAAGLLGSDAAREASNRLHPLGRVGTAADIAPVIAHLLAPSASWISGQVFHLDGGLGALRLPQ